MSTDELTKQEEALLKELQAKQNRVKLEKEKAYTANKLDYAGRTVEAYKAKAIDNLKFMEKQLYEAGCMWELMAEYGDLRKGNQGYFEILTEDGKYKVTFKNATKREFNDTASIAIAKLKECVEEGILGADDSVLSKLGAENLKKSSGKINVDEVHKLYKREREVNHPKFTDTMDLFREAYQEVGKAAYITVHEKNDNGGWKQLVIDPSRLR